MPKYLFNKDGVMYIEGEPPPPSTSYQSTSMASAANPLKAPPIKAPTVNGFFNQQQQTGTVYSPRDAETTKQFPTPPAKVEPSGWCC